MWYYGYDIIVAQHVTNGLCKIIFLSYLERRVLNFSHRMCQSIVSLTNLCYNKNLCLDDYIFTVGEHQK